MGQPVSTADACGNHPLSPTLSHQGRGRHAPPPFMGGGREGGARGPMDRGSVCR